MEDKNPESSKEYHEEVVDEKEIEALEKFKINLKNIIDKKENPCLNSSILSDNDSLIHFLRARKLNIKKSTEMILDYFKWKEKINLDNVYLNYELKDKYKLQLIIPHGFHKVTKDGYPLYFHVMGYFKAEEFFKIGTSDELTTYATKVIETLVRDYFKVCSQIKGSYIYGAFGVVDFKGINSSILGKKFLGYVKALAKLQDYYPEILVGINIINAGFLFRTFYTAIKIFIDSKTRKKIKVYGEKYQEGLLEKIDKENIPKFYGGTCECPGGCLYSNEGPWKKKVDTEETIPEDILIKRKEINDSMALGKLKASPEDKIKKDGKIDFETEEL